MGEDVFIKFNNSQDRLIGTNETTANVSISSHRLTITPQTHLFAYLSIEM